MENRCIICSSVIPEGRMVCQNCEYNIVEASKRKTVNRKYKDSELVRLLRKCGSEESCSGCEYSDMPDAKLCDEVLLQAADRLELLSNYIRKLFIEVVCNE